MSTLNKTLIVTADDAGVVLEPRIAQRTVGCVMIERGDLSNGTKITFQIDVLGGSEWKTLKTYDKSSGTSPWLVDNFIFEAPFKVRLWVMPGELSTGDSPNIQITMQDAPQC